MSSGSEEGFYSQLVIHDSFEKEKMENKRVESEKKAKVNKLNNFLKKIYDSDDEDNIKDEKKIDGKLEKKEDDEGIDAKLSMEMKKEIIKNKSFFRDLSRKFYKKKGVEKKLRLDEKKLKKKIGKEKNDGKKFLNKSAKKKSISKSIGRLSRKCSSPKKKFDLVHKRSKKGKKKKKEKSKKYNLKNIWKNKENILKLMMLRKLKLNTEFNFLRGSRTSKSRKKIVFTPRNEDNFKKSLRFDNLKKLKNFDLYFTTNGSSNMPKTTRSRKPCSSSKRNSHFISKEKKPLFYIPTSFHYKNISSSEKIIQKSSELNSESLESKWVNSRIKRAVSSKSKILSQTYRMKKKSFSTKNRNRLSVKRFSKKKLLKLEIEKGSKKIRPDFGKILEKVKFVKGNSKGTYLL